MPEFKPTYDKFPFIKVKNQTGEAVEGWDIICHRLIDAINVIRNPKKIIVLECYQGILDNEVLLQLTSKMKGTFFNVKDFMLPNDVIQQMIYPDVTEDEVFGYITRLKLPLFFDNGKIIELQKKIEDIVEGNIFFIRNRSITNLS